MLLIVDGENFRHQIARVLVKCGAIQDQNAYFTFDFAGFCNAVLKEKELDILYVTTKIRYPNFQIPNKLSSLIVAISASNRRWIAQLTNQNVTVTKAGYLRVKESNACVHCGKRTLTLQEKGVNVRVATELLLASSGRHVRDIALGSSDSDIIPALEAARTLGVEVKYVCYKAELNRSVAANASRVVMFDDADVMKYFRK